MDPGQRRAVDQIGGKDNRIAVDIWIVSGGQRALDFTQRHGIDLHALLAHQAQNVDVGAGFLGKTHHVELMQGRNFLADNLCVVHPYRAAKLSRQAQQIVGIQVGVGIVQRAWHGALREAIFL
ncbi:hypothetical protein D3C75_599940 [compost metagenome]